MFLRFSISGGPYEWPGGPSEGSGGLTKGSGGLQEGTDKWRNIETETHDCPVW